MEPPKLLVATDDAEERLRRDREKEKYYRKYRKEYVRKYMQKYRANLTEERRAEIKEMDRERTRIARQKLREERRKNGQKLSRRGRKPILQIDQEKTKALQRTENLKLSSHALKFDPDISDEERRFYVKAYPYVDNVIHRKVHCTVCKAHIGTAPAKEDIIRMHPILRVTHCKDCHDFYSSGEFSKGDDGSELYCRWCGQGGEVYCCAKCPFVFCKACIIANLSRGVVRDIRENDNWNCFGCAPKMLWPLRAQHWALINYIDKQKKKLSSGTFTDSEISRAMSKDRSKCCLSNEVDGSDASEGSTSSASRIKKKYGEKRKSLTPVSDPKRNKPNNEVVCTPDILNMFEPECQLSLSKPAKPWSSNITPSPTIKNSLPQTTILQSKLTQQKQPPPLVIRQQAQTTIRSVGPGYVARKTVVARPPIVGVTPTPTPVYHTINGFRVDLNSAAKQETFRLPNGKLIQVKRQSTSQATPASATTSAQSAPHVLNGTQSQFGQQHHTIRTHQPVQQITIQQQPLQHLQQQQPQQQIAIRQYPASTSLPNGTVQIVNGSAIQVAGSSGQTVIRAMPTITKQVFPWTPLGTARTQLQTQICNSMDICQHLMGKIQTLTNSNAYKSVRNHTDIKELYIHMSYLLTYAIGRFKGLQDKCLTDMKNLGFETDAKSLENGQLAADKQASDDDEDEITIVEPKTDTINLDSDNEDDLQASPRTSTTDKSITTSPPKVNSTGSNDKYENHDDYSLTANLLAGMLEVELTEGNSNVTTEGDTTPQGKKQPRKKLTSRPNPTLVKQRELEELERLEHLKRTDPKLKLGCAVALAKIDIKGYVEGSDQNSDVTKDGDLMTECKQTTKEEEINNADKVDEGKMCKTEEQSKDEVILERTPEASSAIDEEEKMEMTENSKMTEDDSAQIGNKLNESVEVGSIDKPVDTSSNNVESSKVAADKEATSSELDFIKEPQDVQKDISTERKEEHDSISEPENVKNDVNMESKEESDTITEIQDPQKDINMESNEDKTEIEEKENNKQDVETVKPSLPEDLNCLVTDKALELPECGDDCTVESLQKEENELLKELEETSKEILADIPDSFNETNETDIMEIMKNSVDELNDIRLPDPEGTLNILEATNDDASLGGSALPMDIDNDDLEKIDLIKKLLTDDSDPTLNLFATTESQTKSSKSELETNVDLIDEIKELLMEEAAP